MYRRGSSPRQATRTRRRCVNSSPQRGVQRSMRISLNPAVASRPPNRWAQTTRTLRATGARTEVGREESRALMSEPPEDGMFGEFGGRFVPEPLVAACEELEVAFKKAWGDAEFRGELDEILRSYGGRPTPLTECHRLSDQLGVRLFLKREDLTHTGSHKLNNVIGQALLARRMQKPRLVAETGAGQHGVAHATAAALFGMDCVVYMGEVDTERQELNVFRMELLGAEGRPVRAGR